MTEPSDPRTRTADLPHAEPGSKHPGQATPVPISAVPTAVDQPGRWGRVASDGTVYVNTAAGAREVGSWQAGDPEEGLAHFARRFDDVRTEAALLAQRLQTGAGEAKHTAQSIASLRESLPEAKIVGDLETLDAALQSLQQEALSSAAEVDSEKKRQREHKIARKEELLAEAEQLAAESTQWKVTGDRLRAIFEEWKGIRGIDRKTDDALWKRFTKARDTFSRRRGAHFAELDRQRAESKTRKEELVAQAEALSGSEDWGPTATALRELMSEWKAAGRAPKDADDALWARFRSAQDTFFQRRSEAFRQRDDEFAANAQRKEEILAEAEKLDPGAGIEQARQALYRLQERWEQAGKVPRERIRELEDRMKAAEERIRAGADEQWRRPEPESDARVAQFAERVSQFEQQAAKAEAKGDRKRAEQARQQAQQWKEWLAAAEQAVAQRRG